LRKRLHFRHTWCAFNEYVESDIDREVKRGRASLISATFLVSRYVCRLFMSLLKKSETSRNHESRQTRKRRRAIVCKNIPTTCSLTRLWRIFLSLFQVWTGWHRVSLNSALIWKNVTVFNKIKINTRGKLWSRSHLTLIDI